MIELQTPERAQERVVPWLVLAVALAAAGAVGSLVRPLAPSLPVVPTELDDFARPVVAAVEAYRAPRYVTGIGSTVLHVLVPLVVALTRPGRRLVARLAGEREHAPWRAALVAAAVAALVSLTVLPVAAWSRLVHDGRWGFRTQSAWSWSGDWLLRSAGTWVATALLAALLVVAVRRWPRSWPYRLTVAGTAVAALFVVLHPLVILPLFLPSAPMPDGPARAAIEEVVARAGDPTVAVHVGAASLRTTRVNALVTGLGPTERVVVHDTLLDLPPAQVGSVVAHELAHQQHDDLARGVLLAATGLLPALLLLRELLARPQVRRRVGARSPTDPRLLALVVAAAAVLELAAAPVANLVSRRAEAAADHRALELTRDPATAVRTSRVFTVRDLATPRPPRAIQVVYGSHPSVTERIQHAVAWAAHEQLDLPSRAELEDEEAALAHPAAGGARP